MSDLLAFVKTKFKTIMNKNNERKLFASKL